MGRERAAAWVELASGFAMVCVAISRPHVLAVLLVGGIFLVLLGGVFLVVDDFLGDHPDEVSDERSDVDLPSAVDLQERFRQRERQWRDYRDQGE